MRYSFWHSKCQGSELDRLNDVIHAVRENKWSDTLYVDGTRWRNDDLREGAERFFAALSRNTSAPSLIVQNANMTDGMHSAFSEAMENNTTLRTLKLRRLTLQDSGVYPVPAAIFSAPTMETLSLSKVFLDKDSCRNMSVMIRESECLKSLSLDWVQIDQESLATVLAAIVTSRSLRSITLTNLDWSTKDIKRFLMAVGFKRSITSLILEGMEKFDDSLCTNIATIIIRNPNLKELSLRKCNITHKGLQTMLHEQVIAKASVEKLYFSGNPLGDAGAKVLVQFMEKARWLNVLCLAESKIGLLGCKQIAKVLAHNRVLRKLSMDGNCFEACGKEVLASLQSNSVIESVLDQFSFLVAREQSAENPWKAVDVYLRANAMQRQALMDGQLCGNRLSSVIHGACAQLDVLYLFVRDQPNFFSG